MRIKDPEITVGLAFVQYIAYKLVKLELRHLLSLANRD